MVFIYILQLQQGKYYVGKTNNPRYRFESHFCERGSAWTTKYKPIQVVELIPDCDDYDEDKYTRIYMDKYGMDNVRGGSFVTVELDKSTVELLNKMSNGTNDKCFACGKKGHFVNNCEYHAYMHDFDTIEKIEDEINNITKVSQVLKVYRVDGKDIQIQPGSKIVPKLEIHPDLYSDGILHKPEIIKQINHLYNNGRRNTLFGFENGFGSHNENTTEFIKSRINIMYIERRKKELEYMKSLPAEYAEIFKKNNYENIYDIVKDKLLLKLELLYEKQAKLFSQM
jgi:hypothetical protein